MLISLSIYPLVILLLHGVASDDLNRRRRIPRRHTEVVRTYTLNHPPSVDNYDFIPVTVVYDADEVINVRNKNLRKEDVGGDDKNKLTNSTSNNILNPEARSVNHPPSHHFGPVSVINDYEEEMILKPKARSININSQKTGAYEKESDEIIPDMALVESQNKTGQKTHKRRSQHVRRVRVSKSELDRYMNKTEISIRESENNERKIAQTEAPKVETIQTRFTEHPTSQSPKRQQTFQKRKQLRDPFVPIIESESYVFSHSGDFHYSYEGGDGTKAFERGELKNSNGGAGSAVEGSFSYKDKDGNDFSLTYTADENGYRPVGAHLPTPPPIPPEIQRALDLLATKTPEPVTERIKRKHL